MILHKGASINYVDKKGEGEVAQMSTILHKLNEQTCQRRGRGAKNPQNFVNVIYGCPLKSSSTSTANMHKM